MAQPPDVFPNELKELAQLYSEIVEKCCTGSLAAPEVIKRFKQILKKGEGE